MTLMQTYNRAPITLVKGKGSYVWDDQENCYLDYTAGIATCNLGHVPDYVKQKVSEQMEKLWHCSNLYHIPAQSQLADILVEHSCAHQAFFCNSGAEANEAAIKLARKYGKEVKNGAYHIVSFNQSFHGRTLAALSATGQTKVHKGFEPLVEGFIYLEYNDMEALQQIHPKKTAAVLLELVQGEGGVVPADPVWLRKLADFCQQNNILLMVDEVQTGIGRTGSLFCYQQFNIEPDVITLAKGLGSGFAIGALLAKEHAAKYFTPGSHASTFGGNPIAATAGLATVEFLIEHRIAEKVQVLAEYLNSGLLELQKHYPIIRQVRGMGLLCGLLVGERAADVVVKARDKKLLILTAGTDVVRILPPLTTTKAEIDQCVSILDQVFQSL